MLAVLSLTQVFLTLSSHALRRGVMARQALAQTPAVVFVMNRGGGHPARCKIWLGRHRVKSFDLLSTASHPAIVLF